MATLLQNLWNGVTPQTARRVTFLNVSTAPHQLHLTRLDTGTGRLDQFETTIESPTVPHENLILKRRVSEILGLEWGDINWDSLTILVQRSVVHGKAYGTKTEASRKPMPIDPQIAEALLTYRRQAVYVKQGDYIFAGGNGKPRWGGIMLTDHIKPAAVRAEIGKVGWHTFRHTFSSILHGTGTSLAVQKELLRQAGIQTTMNIYTQAVSVDKREAVELVTKRLLNG